MPDKQLILQHRLRGNFFDSKEYIKGMEAIINGMIHGKPWRSDLHVVSDVTESLFRNVEFPGSDLIARNIQRGRDHGLPGYNEYRNLV